MSLKEKVHAAITALSQFTVADLHELSKGEEESSIFPLGNAIHNTYTGLSERLAGLLLEEEESKREPLLTFIPEFWAGLPSHADGIASYLASKNIKSKQLLTDAQFAMMRAGKVVDAIKSMRLQLPPGIILLAPAKAVYDYARDNANRV